MDTAILNLVSFPDEKTTDSTRLQMLRGKPLSTYKIAAAIPIVKRSFQLETHALPCNKNIYYRVNN